MPVLCRVERQRSANGRSAEPLRSIGHVGSRLSRLRSRSAGLAFALQESGRLIVAALDLAALIRFRDSLVESALGGVREHLDQNGKIISYQSDQEMASPLAYAERMIAEHQRNIPQTIVFATSKGLR